MGKSLGKTQQQQQRRDVKLLKKNLLTFVIVVFFGGFNILSNSMEKYSPSLILIQQHSDICGDVLCCRLKHSISRASKNHDTISSFPPPEWSASVPSRAPKYDNYTAVIDIINNETLDVPFELGSIVTNKSIPTLPFFRNASTFHPCCRDFLSNATNGEQTFENVEFDLADFFRAMGNNSQLFISGDSVSRGSAQSALCALVAAGADFHYMKWDHNKNEELQNETRDWGHAPSICTSWFMGWSSYHNFSLPHPMLTKNARIPLEGPLILSSDNMNVRTFHQLVWMHEIRSGVHLSENTDQRVAYLLNFGLHWNLGGSVNNHLKFEDDSPAKLYGLLLNQFQNIASLSNPPIVFWRETTPQLFNSIEIDRSTEGCEIFPDIFVGGNPMVAVFSEEEVAGKAHANATIVKDLDGTPQRHLDGDKG